MSSINFTGGTIVPATWLNDVNTTSYTTVPALSITISGLTTTVAGKAASGVNTDITGLSAITSINGGQLAGLRNRIINGGMQVAQRGLSVAVNNTRVYAGADRTAVTVSTFTAVSGGTISGASGVATATGCAQSIIGLTATGTGYVAFDQRIEAANTYSLSGKTITISALVNQDTGSPQNWTIAAYKPTSGSADSWGGGLTVLGSSSSQVVASGAWTRLTFTLTLGASDANNGLDIYIQPQNFTAPSGRSFYISDFSLEPGSVATTFEQRPYSMELMLCGWYYEECEAHALQSTQVAGSYLSGQVYYKFPKRIAVTPTIKSAVSISNFSYIGITRGDKNGCLVYGTCPATGTSEYVYTLAIPAEL